MQALVEKSTDDKVAEFCRKLAPLMGAALAEMTNRKLRAGSKTDKCNG